MLKLPKPEKPAPKPLMLVSTKEGVKEMTPIQRRWLLGEDTWPDESDAKS